jgi:serine/threonine-protein kinase
LTHPNVVTLFDYFECDGRPCIVMEYVEGQSLDDYITARGPLSATEALRLFRPVAEAIGYLHSHGVIHRDIKPNNIKITPDGKVKLLDFGIAQDAATPRLTSAGNIIGTVQYLSPEQLNNAAADRRSEIWALGVLLYEMLTGDAPFEATTLGSLCERINRAVYPAPSTVNPTVPRQLDAVVARCLKRDPADRYQSVEELLRAATAVPLGARRGEMAEASGKGRRALPGSRMLAVAAGVCALLAFSVALYLRFGPPAPAQRPPVAPPTAAVVYDGPTTPPPGVDLRTVRIDVAEGKADIYRDNQLIGQTPYELKAALGERVGLVLKRAGFTDRPVDFSMTENKKAYVFVMQAPEK